MRSRQDQGKAKPSLSGTEEAELRNALTPVCQSSPWRAVGKCPRDESWAGEFGLQEGKHLGTALLLFFAQ